MNLLGVDLARGSSTARAISETGVVALNEDGTITAAGWRTSAKVKRRVVAEAHGA